MKENRSLRACVATLGCRVNFYESRAIEEALSDAGYEICSPETPCDICVVNTCTVTNESDRKSRQIVRRLRRVSPQAVLVVTGCAAQNDPAAFAAIEGVDAVVGNRSKLLASSTALLIAKNGRSEYPCISVPEMDGAAFEPMCIRGFDRTRAYLKIEDGCSQRCAYCAIPLVRGRARSKPAEEVLAEAAAIIESGCSEIVLTGIETSAYDDLIGLIEKVDALPGLRRLRIGSLDPSTLSDDFIIRYAGMKHTAPHFHISVQSGSSRTLARMRRRYNGDTLRRRVESIRHIMPDAMLSADFICGFPGETREDFDETLSFCSDTRFLHLHIFPYSVREGTEAAAMPQKVPKAETDARCAELLAAQRPIKSALLDQEIARIVSCGGTEVLFEQDMARSANFVEYRLADMTDGGLRGEYRRVLPINHDGDVIICKLS